MARLQRALATVPVLLTLSLATAAAAPCPGGRFVTNASRTDALLVLVGDDGQLTSIGDCTVKPQKGVRRWPLRAKLAGCSGYPSKLKLRGRWSDSCDRLAVAMVGKRFRLTLAATESTCGDGFIDRTGEEQCESTFDCPPRQACSDDCRCEKIGVRPGDDADCLPGPLEDLLGLDRSRADSDGDGTDDGAEDLDGDGLANCDELARGTALDEVDTDNDGNNDYEEVLAGTNPLERQVRTLEPGEIVAGTISRAGIARRYRVELSAPRHVLVRVVDTTGSEALWPCVNVYDALGKQNGAERCGDRLVSVARDLGAGTHEIVVSAEDHVATGSFQLEYLPLQPTADNALPVEPDAYIDDELPQPFGFVRVYRFTLDRPRRVMLRLEAREIVYDFSPCFVVLTERGDRIDASDRCGLLVDRDVELNAGTYYVLVNDKENTAAGPYRLRVFPLHPAYARPLPPGEECRTLEGWGEDLDAYAITLAEPATLKLVLTKESGGLDFEPCLRLWDDATQAVFFGAGECSGPIDMSWALPAGTYYATVHDESRDAVGGYCLSHE